jgi:hypothetical protein
MLEAWNFSGVWCLVFGVFPRHLLMLRRGEHFIDFVVEGFDFGFGGRIGDGEGEGLDVVGATYVS